MNMHYCQAKVHFTYPAVEELSTKARKLLIQEYFPRIFGYSATGRLRGRPLKDGRFVLESNDFYCMGPKCEAPLEEYAKRLLDMNVSLSGSSVIFRNQCIKELSFRARFTKAGTLTLTSCQRDLLDMFGDELHRMLELRKLLHRENEVTLGAPHLDVVYQTPMCDDVKDEERIREAVTGLRKLADLLEQSVDLNWDLLSVNPGDSRIVQLRRW